MATTRRVKCTICEDTFHEKDAIPFKRTRMVAVGEYRVPEERQEPACPGCVTWNPLAHEGERRRPKTLVEVLVDDETSPEQALRFELDESKLPSAVPPGLVVEDPAPPIPPGWAYVGTIPKGATIHAPASYPEPSPEPPKAVKEYEPIYTHDYRDAL